jgi:hypothetical protein
MDGFEPGARVVVMAATNRAEILDAALLRPGRFDRTVEIPLPNYVERTAILAIHGKGKTLAPDVDLDVVSRGTPGFSGADLANLVNEAAINAVRANRGVLSAADFEAARDRLLIGRRDASNALLPEEKHAVAVHEAGHALVAVLSEHADPVAKVTILSRGAALGVTEQLPAFERHLYPESHLTTSLAVRLGGRAAEIIVLAEPSTGSANDLAGATKLATHMVREWGFSSEVGPISYGPEGPSRDNPFAGRPYAEETQRSIDQEVARLLREAEDTATKLLRGHRETLDRVIGLLLERETIDGSDLAAIVGTQGSADREPAGAPLALTMTANDEAVSDPLTFRWRLYLLTGPATVRDHQVRPGARGSAGLAESQPRRVLRRQPRPVPHVMPGTRAVLVAVAAFPAAFGPDDFHAAERASPLAGHRDELVLCHLRDPFRCRLAWRGWRSRRSGNSGPGSGCSRDTTLRPATLRPGPPSINRRRQRRGEPG